MPNTQDDYEYDILRPTLKANAELGIALTEALLKVKHLERELVLYKPMTQEEAGLALVEVEAAPLDHDEIKKIVERVLDPTFRPTEPQHVLMAAYINELEGLIHHCCIHSGYTECGRSQMTSEQRKLYDRITEKPEGEQ